MILSGTALSLLIDLNNMTIPPKHNISVLYTNGNGGVYPDIQEAEMAIRMSITGEFHSEEPATVQSMHLTDENGKEVKRLHISIAALSIVESET